MIRLWGTRGSLASSGPETAGYGGNTAAVEIVSADGTILVLDAGTGIRRLGAAIDPSVERLDILLTHLHMDHIQGLGFFAPFFRPSGEIHVWGPASATMDPERLTRYLSPPLFPVRIRDLDARVVLHDAPEEPVSIGGFEVVAQHVIHPGPTVGYRISADGASVAYLPDHEPALGARRFPEEPRWTSGFDLASGVDLLIHDGQYSDDERVWIGWGHSSVSEAVAFAELARVRRLILFHHDPSHSDAVLDELTEAARARGTSIEVVAGREARQYDLGTASTPEGQRPPGVSRGRASPRRPRRLATTSVQKSTAASRTADPSAGSRRASARPSAGPAEVHPRAVRADRRHGRRRASPRGSLLGESTFRIIGRQVREEELKEPRIANLRRRTRRSIEPGAQGGRTRGRDRKDRRRRPSVSRASR